MIFIDYIKLLYKAALNNKDLSFDKFGIVASITPISKTDSKITIDPLDYSDCYRADAVQKIFGDSGYIYHSGDNVFKILLNLPKAFIESYKIYKICRRLEKVKSFI